MSKKAGFSKLIAWRLSRLFVSDIYGLFNDCRDFGFRDQIQRASVSIMNNIAEGYARRSDKSFKNFLLIAKGSLAEVESMLVIATDLKYITKEDGRIMFEKAEEIAKTTSGLIKYLTTQGS
jgi:four helix bundle protein